MQICYVYNNLAVRLFEQCAGPGLGRIPPWAAALATPPPPWTLPENVFKIKLLKMSFYSDGMLKY